MKKIFPVWIILSIAFCNLASAVSFDPNNPPQGLFSDEWLEIYMGGQKIGYYHSTLTRADNKIRAHSNFKMLIGRVDQPIEINMNINIKHEILIKIEREVEVMFEEEDDLF